ncbi:hypothetical protein V6x_63530 [Gimesia chilikensis]|uniref:Uncharacterized protein n=1 Tax=Gimesia chilikensis TaxID=2605989 RepID=A0A517WMW3_9PLAN|nr:hypothetical protein V6x_63530 [Gimesia chilikensis]
MRLKNQRTRGQETGSSDNTTPFTQPLIQSVRLRMYTILRLRVDYSAKPLKIPAETADLPHHWVYYFG